MSIKNNINDILYELQENQTELNKIIFTMQQEINLLKIQLNNTNESFTNTVTLLLKQNNIETIKKEDTSDSSSDSDNTRFYNKKKSTTPFNKKKNQNTNINNRRVF